MNINWKQPLKPLTLICLTFLSSCSKQNEKAETEIAPELDPVSIVVTNFGLGTIVDEIIDDRKIPVFDLLPVNENPSEWTPSEKMIDVINRTRPLVFVAGENPAWIDSLSQEIEVVNLLPAGAEPFQVAASPSQALVIFDAMQDEIEETFPEQTIKSSATSFQEKLKSYQAKWNELPELDEMPENIQLGASRPADTEQLLPLIESNYQLLKQAAEFDLKKMTYEGGIIPILERKCMECHDETTEEGDVNFELYLTQSSASMHPELWETVSQVIKLGQMPPPDHEDQLTENEIERIHAWSNKLTAKWDAGEMGADPGKTTIHRLNKNEYNYTIRDLFKLNIRPADNFPEDGGGEGGFDNNADALYLPPLLVENYFKSASTIVDTIYANSETRSRYLFTGPSPKLPLEKAAQTILKYWSTYIYRKPANEQELARLVSLFKEEYPKTKRFDEAMKMPLYAMLISPNFLYRSTLTEAQDQPYPIDDFELASKLSYFLWSSMPDRELFQLASKGELSNEDVLEAQVKRMLLDEKAKALGMHFGGQWFGWELLRSTANPDVEKFPEFTFQLRVLLYQESMMFFNELIKENGSAYQFLDSNYAYLNETLAKFYKIPGVSGNELRRVELSDKNRGGVLGMGSVLTATSLSLRTSPSIRGAFVLKDMLGVNLPDAPMNIPQLPEDDREVVGSTFREVLDQHRNDPNCKNCHAEIDPIGFGLESFDPIGRFRTHNNGEPVDIGGTLPDGTEFTTPSDLKNILIERKEQFARNMIEKMLSYALGRDLTPFDRPVVKKITEKVIADDAKIHTAFIEIVKSYPFRNRRSDDYEPKTTALN
ncbi:DUF1592 domain-containing protein [Rubritalea spongiae]|uniref:DUF1592 domain-containing protein n=1 Tax=Rubritalea spongiae TaxID=430797 RepID=A0ABW5E4Q4_9BACT